MSDTTLEQRLRSTTEEMANTASVPMELWDRHSNACLEAADELARLRAENEALREERDKARHHTSSLLARIHRDGGHYENEHGTSKAVEGADVIVANLLADRDRRATSPLPSSSETEWRRVEDELPPINQVVIVRYPSGYNGDDLYAWGARVFDGEYWFWGVQSGAGYGVRPTEDADSNQIEVDDEYLVTHWLPLPPAPLSPEKGEA